MIEIIGLLFAALFLGAIAIVLNLVTSAQKRRREETKLEAEKIQAEKRASVDQFFIEKLKPLTDYVTEPNGSYKKVVEIIYEGEKTSPADFYRAVFLDVVRLIGNIALPEDEIRDADKLLLHGFANMCHHQSKDYEFDELPDFIEFVGEDDWDLTVPLVLLRHDLPDLMRLTDIYMDLAKHIAGFGAEARRNRNYGHARVLRELGEFLQQSIDKQDNRYDVLKVEPGCSLEELKIAYRREASLWHPDKLAHLAPELREHAEQQMTIINEAYQSLCKEYEEIV